MKSKKKEKEEGGGGREEEGEEWEEEYPQCQNWRESSKSEEFKSGSFHGFSQWIPFMCVCVCLGAILLIQEGKSQL